MVKKLSAALAAMMFGLTLTAQEVQPVTVGENFNYSLTYSLPKTVLVVTVESSCVKTTAGVFAPYAEKFLGLKDVAIEDQTLWEVEKISLSNIAKADASRTFRIEFQEKAALPTFYLTDDRCLCSINRQPQQLVTLPAEETLDMSDKPVYKASDVLTGEILKAGSKLKQAELVAQEIFSIRESRSLLIKGEADNMPGDGTSLQLMLDNLYAQEEALMSLFIGSTVKTHHSRNFYYTPTKQANKEVAFRFSKFLGYVDADDYAGEPYYVTVQITEDNREQASDQNAKGKKKAEKGIAFCIPGKAHVILSSAKEKLAEGDMYMAQFGRVEQLPQAQFTDKKRPCSAVFTPATGAIKIFEQQQ